MKKILIILSAALVLLVTGCEDFLDEKNLFQKNLDNFYKTPQDISEALAGAYNALYIDNELSNEHIAASIMGDVMLPGGGPDDMAAKNLANFQDPNEDTYHELWQQTFKGIARANAIIYALPSADLSNYFATSTLADRFKNNALGEAHFLRGFFMFRAARLFGGLPIITSPKGPFDVPRASIEDTYGQIAADFNIAAELMAITPANTIPQSEYGHANRWVAKAYLARTYLHFTGYMTNILKQPTETITLPDGGTIAKTDVIAHLVDVRDNSGYALVSDFRNLWPYSQVNSSAGENVLPWAAAENLNWVGQDGFNPAVGTGNSEVMFALRYSYGTWEAPKYRNTACLFFGIRENSLVPFGQGWGWGTIHPQFFNDWPDDDPRKLGSVIQVGEEDQGTADYEENKGDHETGLFNKKYTPLQFEGSEGVKGLFYYLNNPGTSGDDYMLWHMQDFYFLRFADVLLMHSELTATADGINAVRTRSGLTSVAYSVDNLKNERLWEFAFEGIRWFDLVRWGDVETANNYYQKPAAVVNSGTEGTFTVTYRTETKGLVPIPEYEIALSNGLYKQNDGWN